eukprot:m.310840 g.310840  ORF g.310840 m.310840 type:complete len:345 (-) comp19648_c5_seq4:262-1296(-)
MTNRPNAAVHLMLYSRRLPMVLCCVSCQQIAAMRGTFDIIPTLLQKGVPLHLKDKLGRTAADVACEHTDRAQVLGALGLPHYECPENVYAGTNDAPITHIGGGWYSTLQSFDAQGCDIDVRHDLSVEDFFIEYLSIKKPVLIKPAANTESGFRRIKEKWSRKAFFQHYDALEFETGFIPYPSAFGMQANHTTLAQYKAYLDELHAAQLDGIEEPNYPQYVFESISPSHPFMADIFIPATFDPVNTYIDIKSIQFYLGPAGSGAPMHFHSDAYNALVFGRKQWHLIPPSHAVYSKDPIALWLEESLDNQKKRGPLLSCVQESGDMLYVPEGKQQAREGEHTKVLF